jgi:hypothetical protein
MDSIGFLAVVPFLDPARQHGFLAAGRRTRRDAEKRGGRMVHSDGVCGCGGGGGRTRLTGVGGRGVGGGPKVWMLTLDS